MEESDARVEAGAFARGSDVMDEESVEEGDAAHSMRIKRRPAAATGESKVFRHRRGVSSESKALK